MQALAGPREDAAAALEALADALRRRRRRRPPTPRARPPRGALDAGAIGAAIAALLPEGAIVVDESVTAPPIAPPRRAPRRTTGSRSRAARSARACRSPPAPRSPAPTAPC